MRLVADRVVRSFGPRRIFGPLSFEVSGGRVLGIAGANGAGKTTLLRVLAGLLRPTAGNVSLEGLDGRGPTAPRDVPWAIGWAGPDLALYGELTAAENLDFFAEAAGTPRGKAEATARLAAVGLDPSRLLTLPSRMLSTGQRQRLKLAYATLAAAPLLLLDEPGANLDEPGRAIVMKVVAAQRLRGMAVIASNDLRDLALADETVALS
jgi:heme exporter protein A